MFISLVVTAGRVKLILSSSIVSEPEADCAKLRTRRKEKPRPKSGASLGSPSIPCDGSSNCFSDTPFIRSGRDILKWLTGFTPIRVLKSAFNSSPSSQAMIVADKSLAKTRSTVSPSSAKARTGSAFLIRSSIDLLRRPLRAID